MSVRAVIRHEVWTLEPDREPDAEPTTYAMECAVCGSPQKPRRTSRTDSPRPSTAARTRLTTPSGNTSRARGVRGATGELMTHTNATKCLAQSLKYESGTSSNTGPPSPSGRLRRLGGRRMVRS